MKKGISGIGGNIEGGDTPAGYGLKILRTIMILLVSKHEVIATGRNRIPLDATTRMLLLSKCNNKQTVETKTTNKME